MLLIMVGGNHRLQALILREDMMQTTIQKIRDTTTNPIDHEPVF